MGLFLGYSLLHGTMWFYKALLKIVQDPQVNEMVKRKKSNTELSYLKANNGETDVKDIPIRSLSMSDPEDPDGANIEIEVRLM